MVRVLGIVPARGGSKGIPRKNLAMLAGRPLLAYTGSAAAGAGLLDRTIVSTDDPEIADLARRLGLECPFLRPSALAGDGTPMLPVLQHALDRLGSEGYTPDAVAVLQPTSPLRTGAHIDAAIRLFAATGADTVVSVVRVPHQFTPGSLMRLEGDRLVPDESGVAPRRRQDKPERFARNGPAVLVVRREVVESGRLYGEDVRGLEMTASDSVDVDGADDLALAEFWLVRRTATGT